MTELVYTVDDRDRLVYVNEAWDLLALANDAPELTSPGILGRSIFDYIDGPESKHMTNLLLRRARAFGGPVVVPFRCDSSHERRELEMTVTPIDGCVEFRTRVRRTQPRDTVGLLERRRQKAPDMLTLCSWCNRIKIGDEWVEVEEAAFVLGLFQVAVLPTLTHGICKRCVQDVFQ